MLPFNENLSDPSGRNGFREFRRFSENFGLKNSQTYLNLPPRLDEINPNFEQKNPIIFNLQQKMHYCIAKLYCCPVASAGDPQFMHWKSRTREQRGCRLVGGGPRAAKPPRAHTNAERLSRLPSHQRHGHSLPLALCPSNRRGLEAGSLGMRAAGDREQWRRRRLRGEEEREIKFCSLRASTSMLYSRA